MALCRQCGASVEAGDRFCEECGCPLLSCPSCGEPVNAGKKFCRSCGYALSAPAVALRHARAAMDHADVLG
jgi:predicted amidophosphoribosyltransferase